MGPGNSGESGMSGMSGIGVVGIDPATLSPSLLYDKDVGVTVTGQGVSLWEDQGANGYDAAQATDADRPPVGADGPEGDGSSDYLATAAERRSIIGDGAYSVVMVFKPIATISNGSNTSQNDGIISQGSNNIWGASMKDTPGIMCGHFAGAPVFGWLQVEITGISFDNLHLLTWVYNETTLRARVNLEDYESIAASTGPNTLAGVIELFRIGALHGQAAIQDLAIKDEAWTDDELDGIVAFWNAKRSVF